MAPDPTEARQRYQDSTDEDVPSPQSIPKHLEHRKLVGIDGSWYDITDFIPKHPGGPVLEHYIGKDATSVFHAQGHGDVLKYRKPVGKYTVEKRHPADEDFEKLRVFFHKNGYYDTDWVWYCKKVSVTVILLSLAFACVIAFEEWYMHYLGAVILTMFWQQCGFFMHDFMHNQVFRDSRDRVGGLVFGTACFGVSAHWWQDEHRVHHALTNTVDDSKHFADPQMWEATWAQNECLFNLFSGILQTILIKVQHLTFIPFVACAGRVAILIDSYVQERRWYEWLAIGVHWAWISLLLSFLPTWREVFVFYLIASWGEGFLHFQLILSHYCKAFLKIDDYHKHSWYVHMVVSNLNIAVPWWLDWFHGGLNFHIEHHLFPKVARNKLRSAGKYVKEVCDRHDIPYDSWPFSVALYRTLVHLKKVGKLYTVAVLDPR